MLYDVKYACVDPHVITNKLKPHRQHRERENAERGFYDKLEASILEQGFRNPINVWAFKDIIEPRYGGSRLYMAQKHLIKIPCIISDHANRFPDAEILNSIEEIYQKFLDPPRKIYYTKKGINMSGCEHVHLKRG